MWTNHFEDDEKGYQVLLSVYNAEKYLERCFESLERSLKGKKWILLYGDDGCTDESIDKLAIYAYYKSSADKVHLFEYDKAPTVAHAKNRLIKEAHKYKDEYPAVLMMDADDEMLPERANMLHTAISKKSSFVVGAYERITEGGSKIRPANSTAPALAFGPWATLIDCNILPKDGLFFPESEVCDTAYEDILAWYHLKYIEELNITQHTSPNPVHRWHRNPDSASNPSDKEEMNRKRNTFWGITELIKDKKINILENPPTAEEADDARHVYEERKGKAASAECPLDNAPE